MGDAMTPPMDTGKGDPAEAPAAPSAVSLCLTTIRKRADYLRAASARRQGTGGFLLQARAREDLKSLVTNGLVEAGLTYASAGAFSTPRRLTLTIDGLTAESKPVREERKGPADNGIEQREQVGLQNVQKAATGFCILLIGQAGEDALLHLA